MNYFVRLFLCLFVLFNSICNVNANDINEIITALQKAKFSEKESLLSKLGDIQNKESLSILKYLEAGKLYYIWNIVGGRQGRPNFLDNNRKVGSHYYNMC